MTEQYSYFDLNDMPCRIVARADGKWGAAEIYKPGQGFVRGPKMEILFDGVAISREEFNSLVLEKIADAKKA